MNAGTTLQLPFLVSPVGFTVTCNTDESVKLTDVKLFVKMKLV